MARQAGGRRGGAFRTLGTGGGELSREVADLFKAEGVKRRPPPPVEVPTVPADSKVLGVDLALIKTGWAVVHRGEVLAFGTFRLPDSHLLKDEPPFGLDVRRLGLMVEHVRALVATHEPDYLAFEYPDQSGQSWWETRGKDGKIQKRGPLTPYYLGLARGLLVAAVHGVLPPERVLPAPMTGVKLKIAGTRRASKELVRAKLAEEHGIDVSTMTDDQSDAVSVGLTVVEWELR